MQIPTEPIRRLLRLRLGGGPGAAQAVPSAAPPCAETIARALGVDREAAFALASRAAEHQRAVLHAGRRSGAGARRLRRGAGRPALPLLPAGGGAAAVALPLTRAAVDWVAEMARGGRPVRVLRTPASAAYLQPFLSGEGAARLCTAVELLAHARSAAAAADDVYVTFPEHHYAGASTARAVAFLGGEHLFSLLEALLAGRGVRLLAADVDAGSAAPCLRACPVALPPTALAAADLDAVPVWLAGCAERVIAAAPTELLTWGYVARYSGEAVLRSEVMSLSNLLGFLRVWRGAGAGLPDELYGWSAREVERLRAALVAGAAARRAVVAGGAA